MKNTICTIGIIFNTIGTLLTLWTIFATKSSYVGTAEELDNRGKAFSKEKKNVIIGFVIIVIGNSLQIVSMYI